MKITASIVIVGIVMGACLSALPVTAEVEIEPDDTELSTIGIFDVTAEAFSGLSEMQVVRADLGLIWVDVNEKNLQDIVRQMADAQIPEELTGGSFEVIWYPECRFSIDANLVVPRIDVASSFMDDERLVAKYIIEVVLREQLAKMKNWMGSIDFVKIANCDDRPVAFEAYKKDMETQADAITRALYEVGGKLALDALSVVQNEIK